MGLLYHLIADLSFSMIGFFIGLTEKLLVQGRSCPELGSGVTELFATLGSKSKDNTRLASC